MAEGFDADILICGSGAAGLTLAIDLARRGVSFCLIEKMDAPFRGSRGKGIQPRSQEIFEDLGVLDRIAAAGGVYLPQREYRDDGSYRVSMTVDAAALPADHRFRVGTHTVRLNYLGVYLVAPEKVTYQCQLDGVDESWQSVGNRTEAVYTGLRPGRYRFHVKASNGEGVWTPENDAWEFTVLPAFYQTSWFLATCAIAVLLGVWMLFRLRVRQITNNMRLRAEERFDIARDLHDTLLQGVHGLILRIHVGTQLLPSDSKARQLFEETLTSADRVMTEARDRIAQLRSESRHNIGIQEFCEKTGADLNDGSIRFVVNTNGTPPRLKSALASWAPPLNVSVSSVREQQSRWRSPHDGHMRKFKRTAPRPGFPLLAPSVPRLSAILSLGLAFFCAQVSGARDLTLAQLDHVTWTARDGAPLEIEGMAQGLDGTLWIGSPSGLTNFDGLHFKSFEPGPGEPQFTSSDVHSLTVARDGTLWVGFLIKGIAKIRNRRVDRIYDEASGLPGGSVMQIGEAPDGTMTANARNRLVQLHDDRWEDVAGAAALNAEKVRRFLFDRAGNLWVATLKSLWRRPAGQQVFENIKTNHPDGYAETLREGPGGSIWTLLTFPGKQLDVVERLAVGRYKDTPIPHVPTDAEDILADTQGLLWIASAGGLQRFSADHPVLVGDKHTIDIREPSIKYDSLVGPVGNRGGVLLEDASGAIWLATAGTLERFREPVLERFVAAPVSRFSALAGCPSGEMWISDSHAGLVAVKGGAIVARLNDLENFHLHCDAGSTLWLQTSTYFAKYGPNGDTTHLPVPPEVDVLSVRSIVGHDEHRLFVSVTRNGLWQVKDGTWSRVSAPRFPDATPFSLFEDKAGALWAGFVDNRVGRLVDGVGTTFDLSASTPLGIVEAFLESRYGMMLGGTNGIALLYQGAFQQLLTDDRSSVRGISGLLEAKNGDLWLNGIHGIVRIPAEEVAKALRMAGYPMHAELFAEAGIVGPSSQLLRLPTAAADTAGRLWFTTSATVVSVDPDSIHPSTTAPILSPVSMTVDGAPLPADHRFPAGAHTARLSFLGVYLTAPQKVTYQYKLDGVDESWQAVGNRTEAVYTGLRPGRYRFHVKASNGQGVWTPENDSWQFTVLPAFYQTAWFLVACAATVLFIIWIIFRLRVRQITNVMRLRAEERFDIARDLHDTLLQGVHGLILRIHVAAQLLPTDSKARQLLDDTLTSADRVMTEARDRVGQLRSKSRHGVGINEFCEKTAAELNDGSIRFAVNAEGTPLRLQPLIRDDVYFIAREALTNAFRHSKASDITVTIEYQRAALVLRFTDNGCGFTEDRVPEATSLNHWGITGMRERARKWGAAFDCLSAPAKGTTITVTIPARRAYAKG